MHFRWHWPCFITFYVASVHHLQSLLCLRDMVWSFLTMMANAPEQPVHSSSPQHMNCGAHRTCGFMAEPLHCPVAFSPHDLHVRFVEEVEHVRHVVMRPCRLNHVCARLLGAGTQGLLQSLAVRAYKGGISMNSSPGHIASCNSLMTQLRLRHWLLSIASRSK